MKTYEGVDYVNASVSILRDAQGNPIDTEVVLDPQFDNAFTLANGEAVAGTPLEFIMRASSPMDLKESLIASNTRGLSATDFNWKITIRPYDNPYMTHLTRRFFVWLPRDVAMEFDLDTMREVPQADGPNVHVPNVVSIGNLTGIITEEQLRDYLGVPVGTLDDYALRDEVHALFSEYPGVRVGRGEPTTVPVGTQPGWVYLDLDTGNLYQLGA